MKYEDLKTKEDFDKWYGRKPGWENCKHTFEKSKDTSVYAKSFRVVECTKCGLEEMYGY